MPTYMWTCDPCERDWDVVCRIAERDEPSPCPKCQATGKRVEILRTNFTGASDWNVQGFNPGLGCYTKSTKHAREIAKRRGMEEVGSEKLETIHKHFDKQREETRAERWREADREKLYGD